MPSYAEIAMLSQNVGIAFHPSAIRCQPMDRGLVTIQRCFGAWYGLHSAELWARQAWGKSQPTLLSASVLPARLHRCCMRIRETSREHVVLAVLTACWPWQQDL